MIGVNLIVFLVRVQKQYVMLLEVHIVNGNILILVMQSRVKMTEYAKVLTPQMVHIPVHVQLVFQEHIVIKYNLKGGVMAELGVM